MSEQIPMANKRLSVSAILFAIVGGIVGIAVRYKLEYQDR
jgi:hypothetical protein